MPRWASNPSTYAVLPTLLDCCGKFRVTPHEIALYIWANALHAAVLEELCNAIIWKKLPKMAGPGCSDERV